VEQLLFPLGRLSLSYPPCRPVPSCLDQLKVSFLLSERPFVPFYSPQRRFPPSMTRAFSTHGSPPPRPLSLPPSRLSRNRTFFPSTRLHGGTFFFFPPSTSYCAFAPPFRSIFPPSFLTLPGSDVLENQTPSSFFMPVSQIPPFPPLPAPPVQPRELGALPSALDVPPRLPSPTFLFPSTSSGPVPRPRVVTDSAVRASRPQPGRSPSVHNSVDPPVHGSGRAILLSSVLYFFFAGVAMAFHPLPSPEWLLWTALTGLRVTRLQLDE